MRYVYYDFFWQNGVFLFEGIFEKRNVGSCHNIGLVLGVAMFLIVICESNVNLFGVS